MQRRAKQEGYALSGALKTQTKTWGELRHLGSATALVGFGGGSQ
jgi:hypothetical protein